MADIVDRTICTIWTICKDPDDIFWSWQQSDRYGMILCLECRLIIELCVCNRFWEREAQKLWKKASFRHRQTTLRGILHFKLELTPKYWKSNLNGDGWWSMRFFSISSPNLSFISPTLSEKIDAEVTKTAPAAAHCLQDVFAHRLRKIISLYIKFDQESGNAIFCFSNIYSHFFFDKFILLFIFFLKYHQLPWRQFFFFLRVLFMLF